MRIILVIVLFWCNLSAFYAQERGHSLSVNVSNNGAIAPVLNEFYFDGTIEDLAIRTSDFNYSKFELKSQIDYTFEINEGFGLGLAFGFGVRTMNYTSNNSVVLSEGNGRQDYFSVFPYVSKKWKIESLEFSTGLGIPISVIQNFEQFHFQDYSPIQDSQTIDIQGGYSVGLSSVSNLRWYLAKRIYLNTQIQFGYQRVSFGGDWKYDGICTVNKKYNASFISNPELVLGIGYRFK
jgi:hypothetical protein